MPQGTYYDVLGVDSTASFDELRQAYKELSLKHHPDKSPNCVQEATDTFQRIAEAYLVLREDQNARDPSAGNLSIICSAGATRVFRFTSVSTRRCFDITLADGEVLAFNSPVNKNFFHEIVPSFGERIALAIPR